MDGGVELMEASPNARLQSRHDYPGKVSCPQLPVDPVLGGHLGSSAWSQDWSSTGPHARTQHEIFKATGVSKTIFEVEKGQSESRTWVSPEPGAARTQRKEG